MWALIIVVAVASGTGQVIADGWDSEAECRLHLRYVEGKEYIAEDGTRHPVIATQCTRQRDI